MAQCMRQTPDIGHPTVASMAKGLPPSPPLHHRNLQDHYYTSDDQQNPLTKQLQATILDIFTEYKEIQESTVRQFIDSLL